MLLGLGMSLIRWDKNDKRDSYTSFPPYCVCVMRVMRRIQIFLHGEMRRSLTFRKNSWVYWRIHFWLSLSTGRVILCLVANVATLSPCSPTSCMYRRWREQNAPVKRSNTCQKEIFLGLLFRPKTSLAITVKTEYKIQRFESIRK